MKTQTQPNTQPAAHTPGAIDAMRRSEIIFRLEAEKAELLAALEATDAHFDAHFGEAWAGIPGVTGPSEICNTIRAAIARAKSQQ